MKTQKEILLKKLADYQTEDGYEVDGFFYKDIEDWIQVGMLGFCGCDCSDLSLEYISKGLEIISKYTHTENLKAPELQSQVHFGNAAAERFFYYWADSKGFTEHGSSTLGWLTDKGKDLLAILREWREYKEGRFEF